MKTAYKLTKPAGLETGKIEEQFLNFLNRGKPPYDYEKIVLRQHFPRIKAVLEGRHIPPYELEIQPSSQCDAHCNFCFGQKFERLETKLRDRKVMEKICKDIIEIDSYYTEQEGFGIETIKFCGSTGEPFLSPVTLNAIEYFKNRGKKVRGFTNGIEISRNIGNENYMRRVALLDDLNISLDAGRTETFWKIKPGAERKNARLEDILRIIPELKKQGKEQGRNNKPYIVVSYVITQENYQEIAEATRKVRENGTDLIRFRINLTDRSVSQRYSKEIIEQLNEAENYEGNGFKVIRIHSDKEIRETNNRYFSSRDSKYRCFTCRLWSSIASNASLYPCGHIEVNETGSYGSLLNSSFREVWESEKRKSIVHSLPGKQCDICSPFSLRTNSLLTFLSRLDEGEIDYLYKKYVEKEKPRLKK